MSENTSKNKQTALVQSAWAANRKKDSYCTKPSSSGSKVAATHRKPSVPSPSRSIPPFITSSRTTPNTTMGINYFDRRPPELKAKCLVAQLTKLGFWVQLNPSTRLHDALTQDPLARNDDFAWFELKSSRVKAHCEDDFTSTTKRKHCAQTVRRRSLPVRHGRSTRVLSTRPGCVARRHGPRGD